MVLATRVLIGLYPKWWRARYGAEFAALLEDHGLGGPTVASVIRGAIDAHIGGDRTLSLDDRRRAALASALWPAAAFLPIAAVFARLPEDTKLTHTASHHPLVAVSIGLVVLGVLIVGLVACCCVVTIGRPAVVAARRSGTPELVRPLRLIGVSILLIAAAQVLLYWSYTTLTKVQQNGPAPTPQPRQMVLAAWAGLWILAILIATRAATGLVRHAPLHPQDIEATQTLAVGLVIGLSIALTGVLCWGVAMLTLAHAAFNPPRTIPWIGMVCLGGIPLTAPLRALHRCHQRHT